MKVIITKLGALVLGVAIGLCILAVLSQYLHDQERHQNLANNICKDKGGIGVSPHSYASVYNCFDRDGNVIEVIRYDFINVLVR